MDDLLHTYGSVTLRIDLVSHIILLDNIRLDVFISGISKPVSLYGSDVDKFKKDWSNWCDPPTASYSKRTRKR